MQTTALADPNQNAFYEQKLNKLIELGMLNPSTAKKQLAVISNHEQTQKRFQLQTRGVASKIKKTKVYRIKNDPIEIPSN